MAKATADTRLYISLPRHGVVLRIMQYAARVSLSDCFALWGKSTGGLKTPGYSKTVLRTEKAAVAPLTS